MLKLSDFEPSAWAEMTPEGLEQMLEAALSEIALDCMRADDVRVRLLAARDWARIEQHIREHWGKWTAQAEASIARAEGQLQ
jgi:hypothetical protein